MKTIMKIKFAPWIFVFLLVSTPLLAQTITLDFSTGTFTGCCYGNYRTYVEDGYTITSANYGFHSQMQGSGELQWYETTNTITIRADQGVFDLISLYVPFTAYAGLKIESPKGGLVTGGAMGTKVFSGPEWSSLRSFTIKTSLNTSDILTAVDTIVMSWQPDIDADGVPDNIDQCLNTVVLNSDNDKDGCDDAVEDGDDDGDGVPDAVDAAPLDSNNTNEIILPLNGIYKGDLMSKKTQ